VYKANLESLPNNLQKKSPRGKVFMS